MSKVNFGENYFASRERISQVVKGITQLAHDTDTPLGDSLSSSDGEKHPANPFLFIVCGEVNAGKSSLLNGLCGLELCKVNSLPETDRVTWYRYGAPPRNIHTSPTLEERFRPIDFLRDFNLVDTPGANSVIQGQHETTLSFLPVADLILFVFPVTDPWGAATWNLISALPQESHERFAIIIQQSDQREAAELTIITEHISDLAMKKIGMIPPIFAVSGKRALEARRDASLASWTIEESGFPAFEDFISRRICDSPKRRATLKSWRSHASVALRKIEYRIEEQARSLANQNYFLSSLEDEINEMREQLVSRLPRHLAGVAEVFETEAIWVTRTLSKWLNPFRSVFRIFVGDNTGSRIESLFIDRLRSAVEAVAESDGADIVAACQSHWDTLDARVTEAIGVGLDAQGPIDENLAQARSRFVQCIGRAAHQAINNLHVRKELELDLRRRNLALKSFTTSTLIFLIAGATCGILSYKSLPLIFFCIATLFATGGAFISLVTRRLITRDFQSSLLNTCGAFAETLHNDYEDALRIFFQDYTTCLNSIRKHLANKKLTIEPKLARWHQLFLTLKSTEQDW